MNLNIEREKSQRRFAIATGVSGLFFGALITFMGIAIFSKNHFGIVRLQQLAKDSDPLLVQLFGVICIIYGIFRLFRAYSKLKGN
jgi:hypothetical protein